MTMSDSVAILLDAMRGGSGDIPVPSCLNQCRNSEMFHCKICSEPFSNIHKLITHGADHRTSLGSGAVRCAFCGQTFSSPLSLSLHQMVKDNIQERGTPSTQRTRSGHMTADNRDNNAADQCPRCDILTSNDTSMERHVLMECSARSDHVARSVSRVTSSVSDFDPMLILRMEMEAVVTQCQASVSDSDHDQKYLFLRKNFNENFLHVSSNSHSSNPDLLDLFDLWSKYIERSVGDEDIRETIIKFEDDINNGEGKESKSVRISEASDIRNVPDAALLSRLESEMMSGLSPCPRDIEIKITRMGLAL